VRPLGGASRAASLTCKSQNRKKSENDDGWTDVRSTSDDSIRGRLGQFRTGVVSSTARDMIRPFAACARDAIGPASAGETRPSETPVLMTIVAGGVLPYFRQIWARLQGRLRGQGDDGT